MYRSYRLRGGWNHAAPGRRRCDGLLSALLLPGTSCAKGGSGCWRTMSINAETQDHSAVERLFAGSGARPSRPVDTVLPLGRSTPGLGLGLPYFLAALALAVGAVIAVGLATWSPLAPEQRLVLSTLALTAAVASAVPSAALLVSHGRIRGRQSRSCCRPRRDAGRFGSARPVPIVADDSVPPVRCRRSDRSGRCRGDHDAGTAACRRPCRFKEPRSGEGPCVLVRRRLVDRVAGLGHRRSRCSRRSGGFWGISGCSSELWSSSFVAIGVSSGRWSSSECSS